MADYPGINPDHLALMRAHSVTRRPSEVLRLLIELAPDVSSFGIIQHFKLAFPEVPLGTCIEAQAPAQLYSGGMSDEEFDALFAYWLTPSA